jgi:hypothetical protein
MSIIFNDADHSYKSIDGENIDWVSVTTLISNFKKPFDGKAIAAKVSKNKRSKWFGVEPETILKIWDDESQRAMSLGTFYHNQREADLCSLASIEKDGVTVPIFSPNVEPNGIKVAPNQKLESGVYPEHMVYLKSAGICGQSDLVEVVNNRIYIIDYKTNKEIKTESFVNWEGVSDKLSFPLLHLDDCNFNHYALQLSIYMYIMLKHNPKLKPGAMFIHHVVFEEDEKDANGYPVTKYSVEGDPVVKQVIPMEVPYLVDEVRSIILWLSDNKHKLKKK